MRRDTFGILLGLGLSACVSTAEAQGVASTFSELQHVVKTGETVTVTDAQGRVVNGRIEMLSPSLLVLSDRAGRHEWTEPDIATIRQRRGDSLWNGMLWGLAGGAVMGGVAGRAIETDSNWDPLAGTVGAGIGAGIGAGVGLVLDALIAEEYVVFQPAPPPRTQVRVLPMVTPKRQGLLLSVSF